MGVGEERRGGRAPGDDKIILTFSYHTNNRNRSTLTTNTNYQDSSLGKGMGMMVEFPRSIIDTKQYLD